VSWSASTPVIEDILLCIIIMVKYCRYYVMYYDNGDVSPTPVFVVLWWCIVVMFCIFIMMMRHIIIIHMHFSFLLWYVLSSLFNCISIMISVIIIYYDMFPKTEKFIWRYDLPEGRLVHCRRKYSETQYLLETRAYTYAL
jgi:hypothetical protein